MNSNFEITTEFKSRYLERRKNDFLKLKDQSNGSNFDLALTIGHQIKGNADTFGFFDLKEIGMKLEEAGKSKDHHHLFHAISLFEDWIESQLKENNHGSSS